MADVGEIWHRARHDRAFREQLEHDPAAALSGAGLTDDELALLDAALRASQPSPASRALFAVDPGRPAEALRETSSLTESPHPPARMPRPEKDHP
jgi:hypothetical protein